MVIRQFAWVYRYVSLIIREVFQLMQFSQIVLIIVFPHAMTRRALPILISVLFQIPVQLYLFLFWSKCQVQYGLVGCDAMPGIPARLWLSPCTCSLHFVTPSRRFNYFSMGYCFLMSRRCDTRGADAIRQNDEGKIDTSRASCRSNRHVGVKAMAMLIGGTGLWQ